MEARQIPFIRLSRIRRWEETNPAHESNQHKKRPLAQSPAALIYKWRERVGIEPTQDGVTAPHTVLKCVSGRWAKIGIA